MSARLDHLRSMLIGAHYTELHQLVCNLNERIVGHVLTEDNAGFWFGRPGSPPEWFELREVEKVLARVRTDRRGYIIGFNRKWPL